MHNSQRLFFYVLLLFVFIGASPLKSFAKNDNATSLTENSALFHLGKEFAMAQLADDKEASRAVLKKALKVIYKTKTPIEKFESWASERQKFSGMVGEAFTVAVAIAAAELFLHPESSTISSSDIAATVLTSVGIVVGTYTPYNWLSSHLKSKQNRKLLNSFFEGAASLIPLPESPEGMALWLVEVVGPSKTVSRCSKILGL